MLSKMKNVSILNKDPVQDGKYNYHDSLQTHLVEGILAVGARKKWLIKAYLRGTRLFSCTPF